MGVLAAITVNVICASLILSAISSPQVKQNVRQALGVSASNTVILPTTDSAGKVDEVVSVVSSVSPAVVSIVITKDVPVIEQYWEQMQNPFGGMFGNIQVPGYRQNGTQKQEVGGGSGFFISNDGYVVTNAHVVADTAAEYTVLLNDGAKYEAKIIAADDVLDIALLKIEANDLPYLEFGDSDAVKVGQTAVAIGNALGEFRNTVSVGVVSGLSRSITASNGMGSSEQLQDIIQTDAAINPGNSGGPLLDLAGKVVGVNVATSAGGAENIGFALSANAIKTAIQSMKDNGRVVRPFLGVRYYQINPEFAKQNGLTVDYGVIVRRGDGGELAVIPGSPADKAGIEENDIITKVDGTVLDETHSLPSIIRRKNVGDSLKLTVIHDGEEKEVTAYLTEAPSTQN